MEADRESRNREDDVQQEAADEVDQFVLTFLKESHVFKYLVSLTTSGVWNAVARLVPFQMATKTPNFKSSSDVEDKISWEAILSILFMKVLILLSTPLAVLGWVVELFLNVVYANGGLKQTLHILLLHPGHLAIPPRDRYYSFIGFLDSREDLLPELAHNGFRGGINDMADMARPDRGNIIVADVCMMAAKLAYENQYVIERVVKERWKMHFHKFFDCWNEYLERNTTQGFIFTDKERDANAVVLAFRGTSPFNTYDWCTDFDFSWYALPGMGKVHVGFLEALGLGTRTAMETFQQVKTNARMKAEDTMLASKACSGLPDRVLQDSSKVLAFDAMTATVRDLLKANPNAKFYVCGHSLGGALSALFAGLLLLVKDSDTLNRLGGVFTFGQPRVGNHIFAKYMEKHLCSSGNRKYFRIVYCSDLVPRVPFDDDVFLFKHFGPCHYYDILYEAKTLAEEPLKNLSVAFAPSTYVNAVGELVQSVISRYCRSEEEDGETVLSLAMRVVGLGLPAIAAHSPVNYVNSIRSRSTHLKWEIENLNGEVGSVTKNYRQLVSQNYRQLTTKLFSSSRKMETKWES